MKPQVMGGGGDRNCQDNKGVRGGKHQKPGTRLGVVKVDGNLAGHFQFGFDQE